MWQLPTGGICPVGTFEFPYHLNSISTITSSLGVQGIFDQTGIWVEIPQDGSATIKLFGPEDQLSSALSLLFEKANSIKTCDISCPAWLMKYVIGKNVRFKNYIVKLKITGRYGMNTMLYFNSKNSDLRAKYILNIRFSFVSHKHEVHFILRAAVGCVEHIYRYVRGTWLCTAQKHNAMCAVLGYVQHRNITLCARYLVVYSTETYRYVRGTWLCTAQKHNAMCAVLGCVQHRNITYILS